MLQSKHSLILIALLVILSSPMVLANDPYAKKQQFLNLINAPIADQILSPYFASGASPTQIGLIDQGSIAPGHTELSGSIYSDSDTSDNSVGHGHFVLGIMAAKSNNSYGIRGVAGQNAQFLYRSLRKVDGRPDIQKIVDQIREFGRRGFDAVNLSFGIETKCQSRHPRESQCHHAIVAQPRIRQALLETARAYGTVFVISAGNSSESMPRYSSPSDGILVVGSATKKFSISGYSNFGPGVDLYVAETGLYSLNKKGIASPMEGTSFTTPVVTAAIAQAARYLKNNRVHFTAGELALMAIQASQSETGLLKGKSSGRHFNFGKLMLEAQRRVEMRR